VQPICRNSDILSASSSSDTRDDHVASLEMRLWEVESKLNALNNTNSTAKPDEASNIRKPDETS